jgi:tetratricopeptide (TPR) repeat protein
LAEEQGKAAEGVCLSKECLAVARAVYGDNSPEVSDTLIELGEFYVADRMFNEAEECFRRAIEIDKDRSGRLIKLFKATDHLSNLLAEIGEYPQAEILRKRAIAICEATSFDNPKRQLANLAICHFSYSSLLTKVGRTGEAEEMRKIAEDLIERVKSE